MAMIDYGAVVFKNGKRINHDMFMDMQEAVGWSGEPDGDYFVYVGDSHVTVCFYKTYFVVFLNGGKVDAVLPGDWRSIQREYDGAKVRVKRIADWVFHFSMKYNGDRYHVIYGYGIDPDKKVWDHVKVDYLGKNVSRKVDRLMGKLEVSEEE